VPAQERDSAPVAQRAWAQAEAIRHVSAPFGTYRPIHAEWDAARPLHRVLWLEVEMQGVGRQEDP